MHYLIGAIVYAKNKEEAFEEATGIFERLIERRIYDYYCTMDDSYARWKEGKVLDVESKKGKELVERLMKFTKDHWFENINHVRTLLNKYSDEELYDFEIGKEKGEYPMPSGLRWYCHGISQYNSTEVHLYDNDGEGIEKDSHLRDVLNKWESLSKGKYAGLNVYIIPADVHS